MSNRKKEKKGNYIFVTLETEGRKNWFATDGFRTKVELRWVEVMRAQSGIDAEEYAVNDHALHALILMVPEAGRDEEERLNESVAAFMELTHSDWARKRFTEPGFLWNPKYKYRPIQNDTELGSLREFIVQKMLGGEEINDLEDYDFDGEEDE